MRARRAGLVAVVATMAAAPTFAQAPSGEAVYKQNCAACHEGTLPRMPTRADVGAVNKVPAKGGGMNGPGATVAVGMLFVNSGYGSIGFMAGNAILAFSVDGR